MKFWNIKKILYNLNPYVNHVGSSPQISSKRHVRCQSSYSAVPNYSRSLAYSWNSHTLRLCNKWIMYFGHITMYKLRQSEEFRLVKLTFSFYVFFSLSSFILKMLFSFFVLFFLFFFVLCEWVASVRFVQYLGWQGLYG